MAHTVAKKFQTAHRRFAVGAVVTEADLGDSFAGWVDGGFVVSDEPVVAVAAEEPAVAAAEPEVMDETHHSAE